MRREQLTPHMIRIVFGGDGLAEFEPGDATDSYVKLELPPLGAPYAMPYDVAEVKRDVAPEFWPVMRSYTVRKWDAAARELTVDFVVHGDAEGVAAPWAINAQPGNELFLRGPGGGYAPRIDADWHLFVGDESALPAIQVAIESLPAGSRVRAIIEVASAADEQALGFAAAAAGDPVASDPVAADIEVIWLHRDAGATDIVQTVQDLEFLGGQVHAFVHGDAGFVRELRRYLRVDKALPKEFLSISGYWKRGLADEDWRSAKKEWAKPVDEREAALDAAP